MEKTRELHEELLAEVTRALSLSRRFKGGSLEHWYDGRYTAFRQAADLLGIALDRDEREA